jgi:hypothetical protein
MAQVLKPGGTGTVRISPAAIVKFIDVAAPELAELLALAWGHVSGDTRTNWRGAPSLMGIAEDPTVEGITDTGALTLAPLADWKPMSAGCVGVSQPAAAVVDTVTTSASEPASPLIWTPLTCKSPGAQAVPTSAADAGAGSAVLGWPEVATQGT